MKLGITLLGELKEMKEKMDLVWNDLFERSPGRERRIFNGLKSFQDPQGREEGVLDHGQTNISIRFSDEF